MALRVSESQMFFQATRDSNRARRQLNEATLPLTTQQRVSRPSEDPVVTGRLSRVQRELSKTGQYSGLVDQVQTYHTMVESTLGTIGNTVMELQDLAVQMASDNIGPAERSVAAEQVAQLTQSLKMMGNQRQGGRYLFAGRLQNAPPYDSKLEYQGDEIGRKVMVGDNRTVDGDVVGPDVFGGASTGIKSLFKTAEDFFTALKANDVPNIQAALDELRSGHERVLSAHVRVGTILTDLDTVELHHSDTAMTNEIRESDLIGVDFAKATHDLAFSQSVLEATIKTTQRVFDAIDIRRFNL